MGQKSEADRTGSRALSTGRGNPFEPRTRCLSAEIGGDREVDKGTHNGGQNQDKEKVNFT